MSNYPIYYEEIRFILLLKFNRARISSFLSFNFTFQVRY